MFLCNRYLTLRKLFYDEAGFVLFDGVVEMVFDLEDAFAFHATLAKRQMNHTRGVVVFKSLILIMHATIHLGSYDRPAHRKLVRPGEIYYLQLLQIIS